MNRSDFPIVFIDDAHTFGGAQIAMGWGIRAVLGATNAKVVCVCAAKTREALRGIVDEEPRLEFIECPGAMPLNFISFPFRVPGFLGILRRLQRRGVRAWWLNLSGIEFCLAPLLSLKALGETPRGWLHNTERFSFFFQHGSRARGWLSSIRDGVADRLLFGLYPMIATPSRASATSLQARISGRKRPAICPIYCPSSGAESVSQPLAGETGDCPLPEPISLWMIGRIDYGHKNNLLALHTLDTLIRRGRSVNLTIVGDGPDLDDLKLRTMALGLADRVTFLGWRKAPWETVPENAVLVIPSVYESMCLVAIDAMFRGLRLVVSPIPVFLEWVPGPLIAKEMSAQGFADKILEVASLKKINLTALCEEALMRFSDVAFSERFIRYTDNICEAQRSSE